MRKDFGAKPFTYPQPVLILGSYDKDGNPDAMNAAWGGISGGNEISMCISAGHKSTKNILERKAFTVFVTASIIFDTIGNTARNAPPQTVVRFRTSV